MQRFKHTMPWDGQFTLENDGDRYEREWWHLLSKEFPSYQTLWQQHIIPLTNRFSVQRDDPSWIMLRSNLPKQLEQLAMAHYSVFYNTARATLLINSNQRIFFEDVYALLRQACYNVIPFLKAAKWICEQTQVPVPRASAKIEGVPSAIPIKQYRDAFLKNPVLGRGEHIGNQYLPKEEHLPTDKGEGKDRGWLYLQQLPSTAFTEGRTLAQQHRAALLQDLETVWQKVLTALDAARATLKYQEFMAVKAGQQHCIQDTLAQNARFGTTQVVASSSAGVNLLPASGDIVFSVPPATPPAIEAFSEKTAGSGITIIKPTKSEEPGKQD